MSACVSPPKITSSARREHAQDQDAVREREAVALVHELARQEPIARDDRRQPREVRVRGVGGQHQDQHRRGLHRVVGSRRGRRTCRARSARRPSRSSLGTIPYACASSVMPMNIVIDSAAIVTSVRARRCGFPAGGTPARRSTPPRRRSSPCSRSRTPSAARTSSSTPMAGRRRRGSAGTHRDQRAGEVAPRADADQRQHADDEEVGGHGEDPARLADRRAGCRA